MRGRASAEEVEAFLKQNPDLEAEIGRAHV